MGGNGSGKWEKACWYAAIGAIIGGPAGFGIGAALCGADYEGAVLGTLIAAALGSLLSRPASASVGYVAAVVGAGSYLLGGLLGVIGPFPGFLPLLSPLATALCALGGATWFALLVAWFLTRGPFPGAQ